MVRYSRLQISTMCKYSKASSRRVCFRVCIPYALDHSEGDAQHIFVQEAEMFTYSYATELATTYTTSL